MKSLLKIISALVVLAIVVVVAGYLTLPSRPYDATQFAAETGTALQQSSERGRYVAVSGDCVACHKTTDGDQNFAGGYGIETPFGTIFASNITSDKETGIGNWTEDQFAAAVRQGKGPHGPLYPAMPYTSYVKLTDQDVHDLWNYMRGVPAVKNTVVENQLGFPFNIRLLMLGWNRLFFNSDAYAGDPSQSDEWNRGRYLVEGATHCAACHTPRNSFGAEKADAAYSGALLQDWFAPAISGGSHGLGDWSEDDIVSYLKSGSNRVAAASGPMGEAVEASFQNMTNPDLKAIAVYIKSLPGHEPPQTTVTLPGDNRQMLAGKRLYANNCEACHVDDGSGVAQMIPTLAGNSAIQAPNPASLLHVVLQGSQAAKTQSNPTGAAMPSFAWRLTDDEIADVVTYVRNGWGKNAASAVTKDQVAAARRALGSQQPVLQGSR